MPQFDRAAGFCFVGCRFSFQELQDQLQNPATFVTDFYESCATAEDKIFANKNAFGGEPLLGDDDLIHKIIKAGKINGSNDDNASDRLDSVFSKVIANVGDALQILCVTEYYSKMNGEKIQSLNLIATIIASDFSAKLSESDINNLVYNKTLL